jgi:hypothetical protein
MTGPAEMALDLESVIDVLAQTTVLLAGLDQADAARHIDTNRDPSALHTRVQHAVLITERIADRLRALGERVANTPPPDGPPISRDSGPI